MGAEVGGYTPGDTWNLRRARKGRSRAVRFYLRRRPNKKTRSNVTPTLGRATEKAGPLLFSTEPNRGTADGKAGRGIYFTNCGVKLAGRPKWNGRDAGQVTLLFLRKPGYRAITPWYRRLRIWGGSANLRASGFRAVGATLPE